VNYLTALRLHCSRGITYNLNERAASRFVGVSKTAETMKRSPTSELNDLTYTPKRRKKTSKLQNMQNA
jgi:hypothetical protein